jgi:hypothetical protein
MSAETASTNPRRSHVDVSLTTASGDGRATPSYRMMGLIYITTFGGRITVRI